MRRFRWSGSLISLVLVLLAAPVRAHPIARTSAWFDGRATEWLAQAAPGDSATFIVGLHDDGTQAQANQAAAIGNKLVRRDHVHQLLSGRAQRNDTALRAFLKAHDLIDEVGAIEAFATFNGFSITTSSRVVETLRSWDRLGSVELEKRIKLDRPQVAQPQAQINAVEWNIAKIAADRVHSQLGFTGAGIVVGGLDTGVRFTHEALIANYRCAGIGHGACWFDAISGQAAPYDNNGHGSHTMGTAVGSGGIGVAPGARWIACKAFDGTGGGNQTDILECFDWFLAPGGNPADAPDVVNNSWSSTGSNTAFQQAVTNWVNAGIFPAFANGNSGPNCNTVGAPASYTNAVGIGATDSNDAIASFSSRGSSPFGVVKPDLVAPGVSIRSAWATSDTSYNTISGTSMATPHVTGLVALMLQANSSLTIIQLTNKMKGNTLILSATACSSSGTPNNTYGWGRIRAYESVGSALGWFWTECTARSWTAGACTTPGVSPLSSNPIISYRVISGYFSGCSWRIRDINTQAIVNSGSIPRITSTIGTIPGPDPAHQYRIELFSCDDNSIGRIQNYQ